ncbi:MAG TPA: hypothetical protein VEL75_04120 [Candidatus Methylomirabilis sp.]|nr:hypothetical protein [Candidatus Methylomirabilis sp.]
MLEAAQPVPWSRRLLRRLFLPLPVKLPAEVAALLVVAGLTAYLVPRILEMRQAPRHQTEPFVILRRQEAPTTSAPGTRQTLSRREAQAPEPVGKPSGAAVQMQKKVMAAPETKSVPGETPQLAPPPVPPAAPESSSESVLALQKGMVAERDSPQRATQSPAAPALPAPAAEPRMDLARNKLAPTLRTAPSAPRSVMRALPPADVVGRLAVKDRDVAERTLSEALARAGGGVVGRREEAGATIVEVTVPATAYREFCESLARIGEWQSKGQPAELPPSVRMTLHLVQ